MIELLSVAETSEECKVEAQTEEKDYIHKPSHYCYSSIEPKDAIREWGLNFNMGSAVKYIARCGRKDDPIQELRKAQEFLQFEIDYILKQRENEKK